MLNQARSSEGRIGLRGFIKVESGEKNMVTLHLPKQIAQHYLLSSDDLAFGFGVLK